MRLNENFVFCSLAVETYSLTWQLFRAPTGVILLLPEVSYFYSLLKAREPQWQQRDGAQERKTGWCKLFIYIWIYGSLREFMQECEDIYYTVSSFWSNYIHTFLVEAYGAHYSHYGDEMSTVTPEKTTISPNNSVNRINSQRTFFICLGITLHSVMYQLISLITLIFLIIKVYFILFY